MQITKVAPAAKTPGRYNVFVDGQYSFSLDELQLVQSGIHSGLEIGDEQLANFRNESEFGKNYIRAIDLISRRLRSEKEIRELFKFLRIQRPESMERKSRETGNEPVSQPARDNIFKQIGDMVSKIWGRMKVWHIILFTTLVILALWAVFFFKNVKETIDYVDEIESTDGPTQVSDPNTDRQTIVTDVVYDWNQCHSRKDAKAMARLFAPKVKYYQETYTPERIAAHKQGLFDKYPEFRQGVSNLEYTALSDNKIKVHFDKKVWTSADGKATVYPSYLVVEKIGDKWLISEESDDITDRNLARKRQE